MNQRPPGTDGAANLERIEHIVVLMLENRSFDHMLGYLSLEKGRADIEGLTPGLQNLHNETAYPIRHLDRTAFDPDEDPDHSDHAVAVQINGGKMDGFATAFAELLAKRKFAGDPGLVMGYYNGSDLCVYDHLAEHFCICDHWHASVPGATWPNRLYAITGQADNTRDDPPQPEPPLYDKPSFVRHLDANNVSWRWYSYDPGTLRFADAHYALGHYHHFAYVDKTKLHWKAKLTEWPVIDETSSSFLEDAATENALPSVAWIDPNFKDGRLFGGISNDDHPPSDIWHGQELAFSIYNALASGPNWSKTLLIITYDEHGGFYDHIPPPAASDDNPNTFGHYGVRVPALIVSPFVGEGIANKTLFDHTTIIKTILLRFAPQALQQRPTSMPRLLERLIHAGKPHPVGKRVAAANHLGSLLTEATPRTAPDRTALAELVASRNADRARQAIENAHDPPKPVPLTDLQSRVALAAGHLRKRGLPPAQP
jgi:phospholipase C